MAQQCHAGGTDVPSGWHNRASAMAQLQQADVC